MFFMHIKMLSFLFLFACMRFVLFCVCEIFLSKKKIKRFKIALITSFILLLTCTLLNLPMESYFFKWSLFFLTFTYFLVCTYSHLFFYHSKFILYALILVKIFLNINTWKQQLWILIFITITILRQNHELTDTALIYLRLYDSVAKQIKQQAASRWFAGSKPGRDFKSSINWTPFQVEFTKQQKS